MNCCNKANICINCKNAVPDNRGHGCPWSERFDPVHGWTAEPSVLRAGYGKPIETYRITACPMFDRDDRCEPEKDPARYKPIRVRCLETGVVYRSQSEAARVACGKNCAAFIGEALRQGRSYACGYHWEVVEDEE